MAGSTLDLRKLVRIPLGERRRKGGGFLVKKLGLAILLLASMLTSPLVAQNIISTVAGGELPNNVAPTAAGLEGVADVVRDPAGNLYVLTDIGVIYKVPPVGLMTIYAGSINGGFAGDGGPATKASLNEPFAGALDAAGNLYFSDSANCEIRKITAATGIITTIVGGTACGYTGDGGPASAAQINFPQGVALDAAGNIFIADNGNDVIRRIDAVTQNISTFAGNGNVGYTGDDGAATQATLNFPEGIATDAAGNLYIADSSNNVIRMVNAASNLISTVAGTGVQGYSGDGGPATAALFFNPEGVAVDATGNLYISDTDNAVVRKVDTNHNITTIIGNHNFGFGGDGGPAINATLTNTFGLAVDAAGDVWVADLWNNRVRMYTAASGILNTVVGDGSVYDGGPATSASLYFPRNPTVDNQNNIYITDEGNNRIREVNAKTGIITTIAGVNVPCVNTTQTCGDGGPATAANLFNPHSVGLDFANTGSLVIIADTGDNRIRQVDTATGIITTIVGTGVAGFSGDGGPATAAQINSPRGFAYDTSGNLYFVDTSNHRIRKIDKTTGIISTVAGSGGFAARSQGCGRGGYTGDGGPATSATLHCPLGLDIDANNNIYIADYLNDVIREVNGTTGIITTIVGTGVFGYTGDGGPATAATLNAPDRVSVNGAGNLFISDSLNNVIRRVDGATHIITTFAGNGTAGFSGDGGPALQAELAEPTGVVVTSQGFLYTGDLLNNRIRLVTLSAAVTLSSNTVAFGNQIVNTTSAGQNVTITNSGDSPLNIGSVVAAGDFALGTNSCGTTLAIGAQCAISVSFTPTSVGPITGTITINDDAPVAGSTQVINLTGTGTAGAAIATFNPTAVTFPATALGSSSAPITLTLTNTGNATLMFSQTAPPTFTGPNVEDFLILEGSTCNAETNLQPDTSCTYIFQFTPTGTGVRTATLTVTDNAGVQKVVVTGTTPSTVSLSATVLNFAGQAVGVGSNPLTLTLTNNGGAALNFTAAPTITGANAGDFSIGAGTTCAVGTPLAGSGGMCVVSVVFTAGATGPRGPATLTLTDSAGVQTVTLSGTGADFVITPPAGPVTITDGGSATFTLTVMPGANGFNSPVTFSAAGLNGSALPAGLCVYFPQPNPTVVGMGGTFRFLVTTTAPGASGFAPPMWFRTNFRGPRAPLPYLLGLASLLVALMLALHLRAFDLAGLRRRILVPILTTLFVVGAVAGCGGGSSSGAAAAAFTPRGTIQIVITATSGGLAPHHNRHVANQLTK